MFVENVNIQQLLDSFVVEEEQILVNEASEQSISHQLAVKLSRYFPGWHVDCEYNRQMNDIKNLIYAVSRTGHASRHNVVPDIIIHQRMTCNNLLAIEIKKSTNREENFRDLAKLNAFREQLGYRYSLFIRFRVGGGPIGIDEAYLRQGL